MKVIIVDEDPVVSLSLKMILEAEEEIRVIALGRNGTEAIQLYERNRPDVLLMDVQMKTMTGFEAGKEILEKYPNAKILFLTAFSENALLIQALHMGAKGYILKQDFKSIVPAVKAANQGQTVLGEERFENLLATSDRESGFNYKNAKISEKELQMIELVAQGCNNKEISEQIFLSEGTIRNYLSNIMEKLKVRDRTQLAIFYLQHKRK